MERISTSSRQPRSIKPSKDDNSNNSEASAADMPNTNFGRFSNTSCGHDLRPNIDFEASQQLRHLPDFGSVEPGILTQLPSEFNDGEYSPLRAQYPSGYMTNSGELDASSVGYTSGDQGKGEEEDLGGDDKGSLSPRYFVNDCKDSLAEVPSQTDKKDFRTLDDQMVTSNGRTWTATPQEKFSNPYTAGTLPHNHPSVGHIKQEECFTPPTFLRHQDKNLHGNVLRFLHSQEQEHTHTASPNYQRQIKREDDEGSDIVAVKTKNENDGGEEDTDASAFEEKHEIGCHTKDEDDDSEDDIPLIKRRGTSAPVSSLYDQQDQQTGVSEVENMSSSTTAAGTSTACKATGTGDRPHPDHDNSETSGTVINWKLPDYEVTTFKDPTSFVIAKVSVPGLVRHEILLSPDHWELELLLIQKIFIPGHKKTYTDVDRDPEPKHSLFSFHTIANIFFGVYDSLRDDPSLPSAQKVGDADVDNVFFAAIDNWRVGIEMNREGYKAVRGIQEFCDVGLEIAFWIKEHGLPKGANKRKRTGGGDKGDKKGPGRPPKVNRLQAKSKVKSSASEKGMKKNMVAKVKGGKVEKKRK